MSDPQPVTAASPRMAYNELWRGAWGDMQRHGPVHRHNIRRLVELVRRLRPSSILDVGCGSGDNLAAVAPEVGEVHGVDISDEALKIAGTRVPSAQLTRLDVERESLPAKFDLVISVQVIEHLLDDISALRHMGEMSRRWVYVSTVQGRMRRSEVRIGHVRNYSRTELEAKMRAAGLRIVEIEGWGFPFYSLYRSLAEALPGGPPAGPMGAASRFVAGALYQLYRMNVPGRGDVITALAETR